MDQHLIHPHSHAGQLIRLGKSDIVDRIAFVEQSSILDHFYQNPAAFIDLIDTLIKQTCKPLVLSLAVTRPTIEALENWLN